MASLQISSFLSPKSPSKTSRIQSRIKSFHSFLDLTPDSKPETLSIDIQYHDPGSKSKLRPDYDAAVIGCGPAGLRLAEQASARGVRVCCVDPDPLLGWPNNYGSWVDEFGEMGLGECLDHTWPLTSVVIDDGRWKHLGRPYGRVARGKLKRRLMEGCAENGVRFHKAKAWTVDHEALLGMSSSYSSQQSTSSQRFVDKRLKTAVEARPPPVEVPTCNCGVRLQMKTSYTERNPCRRFGSCVNNACKHKVWTWLDKQEVPAYVNDCLNIVMDKYGELAYEVETAKRKSEVDSSSSSQQRHQRPCNECAVLRVRCEDL